MNNEKKFIKLTPFKMQVLQSFPFIDEDFDAITNYELLCKVVEYLNKTVDNVDLLNEKVTSLEKYFDELDVQEEINKKLDEMAEDGTLSDIINNEIFGELNNKVETLENDTTQLTNITNSLNTFNNYTNKPLKYGMLKIDNDFPAIPFNFMRNNDGKIIHDFKFDRTDYVNIIYIDDILGSDNNGDGSINSPYKTLLKAINIIENSNLDNYIIKIKSKYVIGKDFTGEDSNDTVTITKNIIIEPIDDLEYVDVSPERVDITWTRQDNYYYATRNGVYKVYNKNKTDINGMYEELTKVNSVSECNLLSNSYYINGNLVYVHLYNEEMPTVNNIVMPLILNCCAFSLINNNTLYMRNIHFYPYRRLWFINESSNYNNKVILENTKLKNCEFYNGFEFRDIKTIYLFNCLAYGTKRDGFNYHYTNTPANEMTTASVIEYNCTSLNCGITDTNENNNCSTGHEGTNILRINGLYQNSKGPVIADIDSGKSILYDCKINQELNYQSFAFFNIADNENGKAILVNCTALQNIITTSCPVLDGRNQMHIYIKNFHGDYTVNETETILSEYTELN